ncbi:MAG: SPOR domain-containing protein [Pseudomonadota bacterium]
MSSVGTTPAQSRLFVEEMKRRARRQVLGALALLFLSLTVLPVLFEKRSNNHQKPPQMRWETTPSAEELDPATENVANMERGQPLSAANDASEANPTIPTPLAAATSKNQKESRMALKSHDEGASLPLLPSGADKKSFSSHTASLTGEPSISSTPPSRSKTTVTTTTTTAPSATTPLAEDALLIQQAQQAHERKLAEKKAAAEKKARKEKAHKLALEKAARSRASAQSFTGDINELRNDELEDVREPRSVTRTSRERETRYKEMDNEQPLPIRPLKATKSRVSEFPDPELENRPLPRATKRRLDDDDTKDISSKRTRHSDEGDAETTSASSTTYAVQMGAVSSEEKAAHLKSRINQMGLSAYVQRLTIKSGETVYRVRMGPFKQRDSAEKTLRTLRSQGYNAVLTPIQRAHASR